MQDNMYHSTPDKHESQHHIHHHHHHHDNHNHHHHHHHPTQDKTFLASAPLVDQQHHHEDHHLTNEDLRPLDASERLWTWKDFAALWTSICLNPAGYMLGSSLLYLGLNWWQATIAVFVGACITLVPLCLNAVAGVKYGIPFPVFARSMFGVEGAKWLALSRGVIGIAWLSLQLWVGSKALIVAVTTVIPQLKHTPNIPGLGIEIAELLVVLAFLGIHAFLISFKVAAVKRMQMVAAPLFLCGLMGFFIWGAVYAEGGVRGVLQSSNGFKENEDADIGWAFVKAVTATISTWSAMVLNIADLSRYTTSIRHVTIGQAIGLPLPLTLVCFVGIFATSAAKRIYNETLWNPADVLQRFTPVVAVLGCLGLAFSVLVVNVTANLISPANDISNMCPHRIDFRRAAFISCVCALLLLPWKLFSNPNGFVTKYLIGYSMVTGAIAGIMIIDFHFIQKQTLDINELFRARGKFYFTGGFHFAGALGMCSVCFTLPGFIASVRDSSPNGFWVNVYDISWVLTFLLSMVFYVVGVWCCRRFGGKKGKRGSVRVAAVERSRLMEKV